MKQQTAELILMEDGAVVMQLSSFLRVMKVVVIFLLLDNLEMKVEDYLGIYTQLVLIHSILHNIRQMHEGVDLYNCVCMFALVLLTWVLAGTKETNQNINLSSTSINLRYFTKVL